MRYITDSKGYIKEVSFGGEIICNGVECTEYTGSLPSGYESLESWYLIECDKLYRWQIIDGDLTLNEEALAPVDSVMIRMNNNENPYVTVAHGDSTGCHHIEPYYSSDGSSGFIVYNDGNAYILSMASTGLNLRYYKDGTFIDYTLDGSGGSSSGGTGNAGVGILSVEQTTTSTEDGGNNIITVTLTDGTKSTFTVKNGSKGSTGVQGAPGENGGYYVPTVTQVDDYTAKVSFAPSKEGMSEAQEQTIQLPPGADGKDGSDGVGIASMEVTQLTDADVVVNIALTDNTFKEFGFSAPEGPQGPQGEQGPAGADGKSAYAYAQDGGYTGTEAEFGEKLAAPPKLTFTISAEGDLNEMAIGTSDISIEDITEAMQTGRVVECVVKIMEVNSAGTEYEAYYHLPYTMAGADGIAFWGFDGPQEVMAFYDTESASWLAMEWPMFEDKELTINGVAYNGSAPVSMSLAKKENGFFYIEGTGTTAGTWLGEHDDITEYYAGLTVLYKAPVASASPTTLNINSLGAVTVVRNATTALSTSIPANSVVLLTYTEDSGTAYWKRADYDANTKTTTGTSNKTGTKLFLAGAASQSSSGATTYSNANCYIGTDNRLYSGGELVPNVEEISALIQEQLGVIENGAY